MSTGCCLNPIHMSSRALGVHRCTAKAARYVAQARPGGTYGVTDLDYGFSPQLGLTTELSMQVWARGFSPVH